MIIQREGEEVPGRARAWMAAFLAGPGRDPVLVCHYVIDQAPDEDLTDSPDTHEMTWAEWVKHHGDYGLDLDGTPQEAADGSMV